MAKDEAPTRRRQNAATVNIQAVADAAGVSKTTVSHVLSGKRPVSASTSRHVKKVMSELGFTPNFFAQALNHNRSNAIALIAQDITNPFYPALARGLQSVVSGQDQVVMLFDAGAVRDSLTHAFVTDAIQRRVDGVVIAVSDVDDDVSRLIAAGIPVVAVGSGASSLPVDWVSADDNQIAFDAVSFLLERGHRRIATISGPMATQPGSGRFSGYVRAMASIETVMDPALHEVGDWTREGGMAALHRLMDNENPPTAVFCANDLMAIGAMDAAIESGIQIPAQLAIIGVDDIDAANLVRPALTTVRVPTQDIGRAAGELLLHRIAEEQSTPHRHILIQHTLIERDSA